MRRWVWVGWAVICAACWRPVVAEPATQAVATSAPVTTAPATGGLTVAVLDFETVAPGNPDLGKQIAEALMAELSGEPGIVLVDRSSLSKLLVENEINLTGLVNAERAMRIGKVVGAQILVTGKVFPLDKQIFVTAKLIGTETSLVDGVLVKGERDGNLGELLLQLADKVSKRLKEGGPKLVAQEDRPDDPLPALKKALAGRTLPKVAVAIDESHIGANPAQHLDPAAQTEVLILLKEAGFTVFSGTDREIADAGVKYVVQGKAFSEFAARIATLVSCSARLEISIVDRKTGEVVYSDRVSTRAIDLAENTAGKSALEKAGHVAGLGILKTFESILPPAQAPRPAP